MTELEELNTDWIGICHLMQLLNVQRINAYKKWKALSESQGVQFDEEFPLEIDWQPSFYLDLYGNPINITPQPE